MSKPWRLVIALVLLAAGAGCSPSRPAGPVRTPEAPPSTTETAAAGETSPAPPAAYLVVSGGMNLTQGTVQPYPFYIMTDTVKSPPAAPAPGLFSIRLLDAAEGSLADYPFAPQPLPDLPPGDDVRFLSETVPWVPGTARVAVLSGTVELASVPVTPNAPRVAVLYPNGGEQLVDPALTVQWEASDDDGDALEFLVQYSPDDGASWQVVGSEIAGTASLDLDTSAWPPSSRARIRVTATDGVNTSWDVSDAPFVLGSGRPVVRIESPPDGKAILPNAKITLKGSAEDASGGQLSGEALSWASDVDGPLGTGASVTRARWSPGVHTITLTATGGDGLAASTSISLLVAPDNDGDGMPDAWEAEHGLDPAVDDAAADLDGDNLTNLEEYQHGTLPEVPDTDGDGLPDGLEVELGTDPIQPGERTTKVSLQFSGKITFAVDHRYEFTKPAMQMLPYPKYTFCFDDDAFCPYIEVKDAPIALSAVIVRLLDAGGHGLSGGTVQFYDGERWLPVPGQTDRLGSLPFAIPGLKPSLQLRLTYGQTVQEKTQDIAANSYVTFRVKSSTQPTPTPKAPSPTVPPSGGVVVVELRDSYGKPLDGGKVEYYDGEWHPFGTGTTSGGRASMKLAPSTYKFRMTYAYVVGIRTQDVGADPTVVFQTGRVHSDSGTCTQYYANGWHPFTNDMELPPGRYRFRFSDNNPEADFLVVAGKQTDMY